MTPSETHTFAELQAVRLKVPDKRHPDRTKGLITGWYIVEGVGWAELLYQAVWNTGETACYLASELEAAYSPILPNDNNTLQETN